MDPFATKPADDLDPGVVVSFVDHPPPVFTELHNPARDGTVTGFDGTHMYMLSANGWCRLADPSGDRPATVTCSRGFPLERLLQAVVRPTLQLTMLHRGACCVHASAVAAEGKGILIAGWSESGKTETALAFAERGAAFLSDKWTTLRAADLALVPFPISVGVRRWVLPYLPRLRSQLPVRARAQLAAAGLAGRAAQPFVARATDGTAALAATAIQRAVALGERASVRQSVLHEIYGATPSEHSGTPLELLVLLQTTPGGDIIAEEVDAAFAATRLARSASYERRDAFDLSERGRYAASGTDNDPRRATEAAEEALLLDVLSAVPIVNVRAPFPVDPRRVVEAVNRWR